MKVGKPKTVDTNENMIYFWVVTSQKHRARKSECPRGLGWIWAGLLTDLNVSALITNMKDYTEGKGWKIERRQLIIETAYRLFSQRGIEQVMMTEIAKEAGIGISTLNRYFHLKLDLVVSASAWALDEYIAARNAAVPQEERDHMKGAEYLRYYMDAFIDLYRNHSELLRFNYNFNSYLRYEAGTEAQKMPMLKTAKQLGEMFHIIYERGSQDGTLNTEIPEETMFSSSFHIMLAAATRYAVGLVYVPEGGSNPESELVMLEELLLSKFVKQS